MERMEAKGWVRRQRHAEEERERQRRVIVGDGTVMGTLRFRQQQQQQQAVGGWMMDANTALARPEPVVPRVEMETMGLVALT